MRTKLKMRTKVTTRVVQHGVQKNTGRHVSQGTSGRKGPRRVTIPAKSIPHGVLENAGRHVSKGTSGSKGPKRVTTPAKSIPHGVLKNARRRVSQGTSGSKGLRRVTTPGKCKQKKRKLLVGLCEQCKKKQKPKHERYEEVTRADVVMLEAATEGHSYCVEACLTAGADVNQLVPVSRSTAVISSLMRASEYGHGDCLSLLIEAGADVNLPSENGSTALLFAASAGFSNCVDLLLKAGADVNISTANRNSPLSAAVRSPKFSVECVSALIEAGANVNRRVPGGDTALIALISRGQTECIEKLISAGVDVNVPGFDGKTALMFAASRGCTNVVQSLIQAGVDVNRWSERGETALSLAAAKGHTACLKKLIEAGADVNSQESRGQTALMSAMESKGSLRCLIESGADVNKQNSDGSTALLLSSSLWRSAQVNLLITAGADVNVVDYSHNTALDLILEEKVRSGQYCFEAIQCIKSLFGAGAKINMLGIDYTKTLTSYFELRNERVNTPLQTCLLAILDSPRWYRSSSSPDASLCNGACEAQLITLFLAAGETVDDHPVRVSDYLDPPKDICLSHLCREAIREHLLLVDPHENLFCRAQQLGLPSALQEYLLYNVTLDDNEEDKKSAADGPEDADNID